ncbi:MAG: folylpolyglutamate synthase/dihydrofolate synthase family protein [Planctomycetota bacterium]
MDTSATTPVTDAKAIQWLYDRINYERVASPTTRYRFTLDRMRSLVQRLGLGRLLSSQAIAGMPATSPVDVDPSCQCESAANSADAPRSDRHDGTGPVIVHIAGTKGKGSVSTMVASMLTARGFRVGLYTSPHLANLSERFRIDGQPATYQQLTNLIDRLHPIVESMELDPSGGRPSFFELTTAMAAEHFYQGQCDVWVLETGLGGRLDSTNVFQSHVAAITSIGLDHQHVLGDTLEQIAAEKAGIFKPGVPAISGVMRDPARRVIATAAQKQGCELIQIGTNFDVSRYSMAPDWGGTLTCRGLEDVIPSSTSIRLSLEGHHQSINAVVALAIIGQLQKSSNLAWSDGPAAESSLIQGLSRVRLDARLERFVSQDGVGTVVLDAAHNEDSVGALLDVIRQRYQQDEVAFVFGTSTDKDEKSMLSQIKSNCVAIYLTRYHGNPRYTPVEQLRESWHQLDIPARDPAHETNHARVHIQEDPVSALRQAIHWSSQAKQRRRVVVACGSFFLAGELRPFLVRQFGSIPTELV